MIFSHILKQKKRKARADSIHRNETTVDTLHKNQVNDNTVHSKQVNAETHKNQVNPDTIHKNKKEKLYKVLHTISLIIVFVGAYLLLDILWFGPSNSNDTIKEVQEIYASDDLEPKENITPSITKEIDVPPTSPVPLEKTPMDKFDDLLELNSDVKGWIQINGTNINYPVLQSSIEDPEYYLTRNIKKEEDRFGSIFLDANTNIETPTQSLLLHGHNMTRSGNMFHELMNYNDLDFLIENSVIQFDSLYEEGLWIIFSVFKTNGSSAKEKLFDYQRGDFKDSSSFLDFVYQIKVRSIYDIPLDISEKDSILLLSTCSYELSNYRTVIAARKLRPGESNDFSKESITKNKTPLYPDSWYQLYGGSPPAITNFEEARKNGEISWYHDVIDVIDTEK